MKKKLELAAALKGTPASELLRITEALYDQLKAKVTAGAGTQEEIRALNIARKEITACKQIGMGA